MQVIPIKVSDQLYAKLKKASKAINRPMADLLRDAVEPKVDRIIKKLDGEKKQPKNFLEYMLEHAVNGKDHYPDKTHDEIIYGVDLRKKS